MYDTGQQLGSSSSSDAGLQGGSNGSCLDILGPSCCTGIGYGSSRTYTCTYTSRNKALDETQRKYILPIRDIHQSSFQLCPLKHALALQKKPSIKLINKCTIVYFGLSSIPQGLQHESSCESSSTFLKFTHKYMELILWRFPQSVYPFFAFPCLIMWYEQFPQISYISSVTRRIELTVHQNSFCFYF